MTTINFTKAQIQFLKVMGHDHWIKDEQYGAMKSRLDELWAEVYCKAERPMLPDFIKAKYGKK